MSSGERSAGPGDRLQRAPPPGATLEAVLDHYLQELTEGRQPDQGEYLARYPQLADALRGVFKTLDFVEATGRALRATPLQCGQSLGEFRIVRELARGGMGVVYEAVQTSLDRRVALKVLPMAALLSASGPERFLREAQAAARLHHTSIVPVYAIGEEQGVHYYAMQFIDGHSLAEHVRTLRRAGPPPGRDYSARVARWGQQVAEALDYAHGAGTIHRDIKPSNLLLDVWDHVWVTDFGLARADAQTTLTVSGDVVGTARYMSPEQARGDRALVDARTDIYSLGATLYELLALAPPFDGDSREDVLNQIALVEPKPLRRMNPAIPRDLETIVAKCMQKPPERRYARARDVAEDCRRFVAGEPIRARRTSAVVKAARLVRRHRVHTVGTVAVLALAVTTIALVIHVRHVQGQQKLDAALNAILFERDARRATRLLDEARALGIDSAELYLDRGLAALLFGKPQRATAPLEEALRRDPNSVETALALAATYSRFADAAMIDRYLRRHTTSEIRTALGWLLHGLALEYAGGSEAIDSFNRAVELRPDFIPALECRANCRAHRVLIEGQRAELEPMLHDFEAWVVFRPTSANAYSARGMGRLAAAAYAAHEPDLRGRVERWLTDGRHDLEQALALRAPDEAVPWIRQAAFLAYVGDFRGAADAAGEALAVDRATAENAHPGYVHYRVLALHALGELDTALREVAPAQAALPSFFALGLQRAWLLAELGRLDEARAVGRETLDLQGHCETGLVVAAFLELLGDREAAAGFIRSMESESAQNVSDNVMLAYLAGHMNADALLAGAEDHPGRRCTLAFLIAMRELGRGNRARGRAALQTCLATGVYEYVEFRFAQVLEARMQPDPQWPPWLSTATSTSSSQNP